MVKNWEDVLVFLLLVFFFNLCGVFCFAFWFGGFFICLLTLLVGVSLFFNPSIFLEVIMVFVITGNIPS